MFKYSVILGKNKFTIEPYSTQKEKDILLMSSFEIYELDRILEVLGVNEDLLNKLSDNEKKVLLYKFREISVGDELNVKFKCNSCNQVNETSLKCTDFIIESEENDENILKLDKHLTDENINDFLVNKINIVDLDLDEFEHLKEHIIRNQNKFNFVKELKCLKCSSLNLFNIGDTKYIIESLSEDTLMSLYRTYNDMTFFGKYTKQDIDSLYPFERTILIGLLNKTREDIKK